MKQFIVIFIIVLISSPAFSTVLTFEHGKDLQAIFDYANDGDTILIAEKTAEATPTEFIEPLCGNCLDPKTDVNASYGFIIKDKRLIIIGESRDSSILVTRAGYGVYFENSHGSVLRNLTITGGIRDGDGNATDAAVVVRNSSVLIEDVTITDNDNRHPDTTVVVGIGGVFGREGADITIRNCRIYNGGWDGVALYRGAFAKVTDCIFEKGRGVGIGVTWDASCVAYRNDISGYWKGIGAFGSSWVICRNNVVHDNLGWGIIATGESFMDITNNVVHHNGNCGIAPWSTTSKGRIVNNIVTENGWRKEWVCPCVGVWNYGDWAKWNFSYNIVWNNKDGEYKDIWDQTDFNGNLSVDPMFVDSTDFHLQPGSPALHGGDTVIYNHDGTVSNMGIYGGPQAKDE